MGGMLFDAKALQSRLAGKMIGFRLHYRETVDSTNRVAMGLAREGAAEGTVVLADCQTAGRGRLQRVWQSPPGCNLYLSVILRPAVPLSDASQITLMVGVAVAEMIATLCPTGVGLKWPNDVLIRGRKVCGILTEMRTVGGAVEVVAGIGLNVNMTRADFDPAYRDTSTSLREEAEQPYSREAIAFLLCEHFEHWYRIYLCEGFVPVREQWLARAAMAGKYVRVLFRDEVQEGVVVGIDRNGALLLADALGAVRRVTAGDAGIMKG